MATKPYEFCKKKKSIPGMVIDGRNLHGAFESAGSQLLGFCKTLLDVKTKTCDAKYPSAEAKVGAAVDSRATAANREYLTRALKLDADLGTPLQQRQNELEPPLFSFFFF